MFLTKRNNGIYYLYINLENGKRKAISTKTKLKAEALEFVKNWKDEPEKKRNILLSDLQLEIMKYAENNLSKSSYFLYFYSFQNLYQMFGNINIKHFNAGMFEKYKLERVEKVKKVSVNVEIRTLKAIFSKAVLLNLLTSNPLQKVKQFKLEEKEPISFSDSELSLILSSIKNKDILNITKIAIWTGMRLNEILNLQWSDIDFNKRLVRVGNKEDFKTKSRKIRYIPISSKLFDLLSGLSSSSLDSYLFNLRGNKYKKDYVSKGFKAVLRSLGLPEKYHFHSLRHTFCSNLVRNNISLNYIKELAGHQDVNTTLKYIHIGVEDLRSAVNSL